MRILVTRPEPQASAWVADLRQRSLDAHALPLIQITAPANPAPVQALWHALPRFRLLMFVSPAAVHWFFRLRPAGLLWPAHTLAATPGPGTARSLLDEGQAIGLQASHLICPAEQAEQFDSEALWPLLSPLDWAGQHVAIVSGGDQQEVRGRHWLAEQWQTRGAQVQAVLSYQRGAAHWTAAQQTLARQALSQPDTHVWLLSSSQALANLGAHHLPALGLAQPPDWPRVRALATHPKIADSALALGIGHITACRPTLEAVAQALRSMSPGA